MTDAAGARLPGDWSDLVVVVGAVPWHGSRMTDHHVALNLLRYGPVLYVDNPVPWRPDQGRTVPPGRIGLELLQPGLALVTPHVLPGHQRPGMKAVALALVRRAMRQALRQLGSPRVRAVLVGSLDPCLGVCDEDVKVFFATDDFVAGADLMRISRARLERDLQRQRAAADLIVASSQALVDGFRDAGRDALLLPNGCDPEVFAGTEQASPAPDVRLDGPAAGFMGHLSSRIDARYLDAIAERGHPLLLVGPGDLGDGPLGRLARRSNVEWVGPKDFESLPSYLRHVDVGLVPYTDTPFNHASFPLKALEYLAAGRPVLSTDIAAITWLREGRNVGEAAGCTPALTDDDIVIARTPAEYADAAERLLAMPRDAEARARRLAFARTHSWSSRIAVLAAELGLPTREPTPA